MPPLGPSMRAAVLGAARRPSHDPWLPDLALRAENVSPDRAGLSAYQHLIGAPGTDVLPPAYLHVLGFPLSMSLMTAREFPLRALGMVHIANRVRIARPTTFEESFAFTTWASRLRPHRRGALVDVELTAESGGGVVWHGTSTYLASGATVAGEPVEVRPSWTHGSGEMPGRHQWEVTPRTAREYAEVSGDSNPIHTSRLGARAFGFPRVIAHGMYTAARALAEIPPPGDAYEWEVVFGKPVLLPARPTLEFGPEGGGTRFGLLARSASDTKIHLSGATRPASWEG